MRKTRLDSGRGEVKVPGRVQSMAGSFGEYLRQFPGLLAACILPVEFNISTDPLLLVFHVFSSMYFESQSPSLHSGPSLRQVAKTGGDLTFFAYDFDLINVFGISCYGYLSCQTLVFLWNLEL